VVNRRDVVVGAALLLLPGCGRKSPPPDPATLDRGTRVQGDIEVLSAAFELKERKIAAYGAIGERLRGDARDALASVMTHELAHAKRLADTIEGLGGRTAENGPWDMPPIAGEAAALGYALRLERTAIAAFVDLIPKLGDLRLRGTLAAILAADAEHLAVWSGVAGAPQVPDAFLVGGKSL
jgi:hypothetical protein